ncbi:MAG: HTTM domain-containing protein, partial [Rubrobacter sp.]
MATEIGTGTKAEPRGFLGPLREKLFGEGFGPSLVSGLFAPVDPASLAFFRVAFGALMFWEISKYSSNGWIGTLFADPTFRFSYYGFDWIQPWPDRWMYLHFLALQILAFLVAFGFLYRISVALFFMGFTYVFLLDQANY